MIGGGPEKDKKFVKKIINQVNAGKKEIFTVRDTLGTPTYTYDFAKKYARGYKFRLLWSI